jgi:hypothetical protein
LSAVVAASATLGAAERQAQPRRLATAARQGLWRALRTHRGLAPLAAVERDRLTLAACYLDGARPPAATASLLEALLTSKAVRDWGRQAGATR